MKYEDVNKELRYLINKYDLTENDILELLHPFVEPPRLKRWMLLTHNQVKMDPIFVRLMLYRLGEIDDF
jgi:hypothetical protein